jgi:hypothetical protein
MKTLLQFSTIIVVLISFNSKAQMVAQGISPAPIVNSYNFTWADPLGFDWSTPDFNIPGTFIQDTLMLVEDGSAGLNLQGNPISQEGCNTLINDLSGKIAVIYRNTCEFSTKALNAQNAGAIGVIIINKQSGVSGMAGGSSGLSVTIPVVMLSSIDGEILVTEMGFGPVVMLLGNINGYYTTNIGVAADSTLKAPFNGFPNQFNNSFPTQALIYNSGNTTEGGSAEVKVLNGLGTQVFFDVSASFSLNPGDSLVIPFNSVPSLSDDDYTLIYTVNTNNTDEFLANNTDTSSFKIQDEELSFSDLDVNNKPIGESFYSYSTGSQFSYCVAFKDANSSAIGIDGIDFSAWIDTLTYPFAGEYFYGAIYSWDDVFTDITDPGFGFNNLTFLEDGEYIPTSNSQIEQNLYLPLFNPITLVDNQRYLACVQVFSDYIYVGAIDSDYSGNFNVAAQPMGVVEQDGTYYLLDGGSSNHLPALGLRLSACPGTAINSTTLNNACFGEADGMIAINATGFTGTLSYLWSDGSTNATLTNVTAGNYTVTVSDLSGCSKDASFTIFENSQIFPEVMTMDETCDVTNDGTANASVLFGGLSPFTFLWNTGETTSSISNLDNGTYNVTITDANDCSVLESGVVGTGTVDFSLAITATPTTGTSPLLVTFDNQTLNLSGYNFTWFFGDGDIEVNNSSFVTHTYLAGGLWDVVLVAEDILTGCTDTLYKDDFIFSTGGVSAPSVSFDTGTITVNENAGTITANVTIANANANSTSVDVTLGTSTATSGVDFTFVPVTVTFPGGSSTTQTVTLSIIDDVIVEANETILLNLQNPTNAASITPNGSQTITITDNDVTSGPTVSFDFASANFNENAGTVTANVTISNPDASPTSVDVTLGTSTATSGVDFTFVPVTVTFPGGSSTAQTVTLSIIDDIIVEANETILLNLQNPTNAATITPNSSQTITITDNDVTSGPTVSFDFASATFNENAGTVTANVIISNPDASPTSVDVTLGVSTATSGVDFNFVPTTVTFPGGSSATQTVTMSIIDDINLESSETIVLNLQNPTNSSVVTPNGTQTITIIDNDAVVGTSVSFDLASVTVNENAGTLIIEVMILNEDANPTSVDVALGASTATIGSDFTYTTPTTVTFPGGSSSTQTVVLGIIDDITAESVENIVLNLQNPTNGAVMGTNSSHTITLNDNDGLGLIENSVESILLYPNPTNNEFTITTVMIHELMKISLLNTQGQIIRQLTDVNEKVIIDISDLSDGIYYVNIQSENINEVIKVVKQ